MRIHDVVNISRVKPYKERLTGQPVVAPGPVEVTEDRDDLYEVDYIVNSCYKGRRLEYLVHWKGYSETDRTWEPEGNLLPTAKEAISDFHSSTPGAPRKLRVSHQTFITLFKPYENDTIADRKYGTPFDRLEVDP